MLSEAKHPPAASGQTANVDLFAPPSKHRYNACHRASASSLSTANAKEGKHPMGAHGTDPEHGKIDGHRLTEFIYGTITAMVAIAGLTESPDVGWWSAFTIIIAGAGAVWVAHAYSALISQRLTVGRRLNTHEMWEAMRTSWPIVTAGVLIASPLFLAGLGLTSSSNALTFSNILGIIVLAVVGYMAGNVSKEPLARRVMLAVGSAAIGFAVVSIELAAHGH